MDQGKQGHFIVGTVVSSQFWIFVSGETGFLPENNRDRRRSTMESLITYFDGLDPSKFAGLAIWYLSEFDGWDPSVRETYLAKWCLTKFADWTRQS